VLGWRVSAVVVFLFVGEGKLVLGEVRRGWLAGAVVVERRGWVAPWQPLQPFLQRRT
jgi:hypothetical protein